MTRSIPLLSQNAMEGSWWGVDRCETFCYSFAVMLMMRLQRVGRRNDPSYRVVVTDKRTGPKSNKHVAIIGSYNSKMDRVQIDGEKAKQWLGKGVQASPTVHNLLVSQGIVEGKKINVLPKKSPIVDPEAEAAKQAEAEAAEAETDEAAAEPDAPEAESDTPAEEAEPEADTPPSDEEEEKATA